jgi:hypothetical protein
MKTWHGLKHASRDMVRVVAGDAGGALHVVGWPGIRSHWPICRALGVGHTCAATRTPSGCGANPDLADLMGTQQRILRALWPLLAPGAGCFMRRVQCFLVGKRACAVRDFMAETPGRCAKPSYSRPEVAREVGHNSCLPGIGLAPHIRTVSLRAAPQGLNAGRVGL